MPDQSAVDASTGTGPDHPAAGAGVTLLPTATATTHTGTIRSWTASPSGLVVTSQVSTSPRAVRELHGKRVWVSARTEVSDSLAVFQAVAQAHRDDEIALTGVMLVAQEVRRGAVRVRTQRPVHLTSGTASADATTVDISRSGCRLTTGGLEALEPHASVALSFTLPDGVHLDARGEVLRNDPDTGEAVVRFVGLETSDEETVERAVLTELTRQQSTGPQG